MSENSRKGTLWNLLLVTAIGGVIAMVIGTIILRSIFPPGTAKEESPIDPPPPVINIVEVPNLVGSNSNDAENTLKLLGLIPHQITKVNEAVGGSVIDQSPQSGSRVATGSVVTLTISEGRRESPQTHDAGEEEDIPTEPIRNSPSTSSFVLKEGQPIFVSSIETTFSVSFKEIDGLPFVTLTISPPDGRAIARAIMGESQSVEFESKGSNHLVNIVHIDEPNRQMRIHLARK